MSAVHGLCRVEVCMGMGFPVGMGFPWEWEWKAHFHGNGNGSGNDFRRSGNDEKMHGSKIPICYHHI